VGAGPAGGSLARRLALAGVSVTLVERLVALDHAAFSSAAIPLADVSRMNLPAEVIGSRWNAWQLLGPSQQWRHWSSRSGCLGFVLDFGVLRQWLAEQVRRLGGDVLLGVTALRTRQLSDASMCTSLRTQCGELIEITSQWVVDATGQSRALMGESDHSSDPVVAGVGLEWLLKVGEAQWQMWAGRLSFLLGSELVPQGYGWVFPMQPGRLKVGVCRLCDSRQSQPSLISLQRRLLGISGLEQAEVLDRHGGMIRSRISRCDRHVRGRLIALGDAISTANLLGGEGIRHAMTSAEVVADLLSEQLSSTAAVPSDGLETHYRRAMDRRLGWRWSLSGRLGRRTWLGLDNAHADRRLERWLTVLERSSAEELSALLFDYRFERFGLKALPYLLGLRG
jgi:flavin-dependent dehydrogenase